MNRLLPGLSRRVVTLFTIITVVISVGTGGYMLIEGWSFFDGLYMTAITLSTIGYGEINPLSDRGRVFTLFLIIAGGTIFAYALSSAIEYALASGLADQLRRRRLMKTLGDLEQHIIVCGYGRVGRAAISTLREDKTALVIIDVDTEQVQQAREGGLLVVEGDATRDEVLREAGLERAKGLLVSTGDDALNLFVVLSARTMNPSIYIVARSSRPENEAKLRRAGANSVVSPYQIGGRRMAHVLLRPNVTDFLDVVTLDNGLEIWLDEIVIEPGSPLMGQTVFEADLRRRLGVTLVALQRPSTQSTLQPDKTTRFEVGDHVIAVGTRPQIAALVQLAQNTR